jgi:hypothetical protein
MLAPAPRPVTHRILVNPEVGRNAANAPALPRLVRIHNEDLVAAALQAARNDDADDTGTDDADLFGFLAHGRHRGGRCVPYHAIVSSIT